MGADSPKDSPGKTKLNCWEVMACGREPDGKRALASGVCPAAVDTTFDGIHSGKCGGRICWAVAGTLCGDCEQGSFAEKRSSCLECDFFQMVQGVHLETVETPKDQAEETAWVRITGLAGQTAGCDS